MLQNGYLLAKFGFDTAASEPSKVVVTENVFTEDNICERIFQLWKWTIFSTSPRSAPSADLLI